jgi:glycosyltransferase involved in cell wall biosynthesis
MVSVVMPVHDAAAFLPLSVGSALAQTLQSLELVCVDDGSSDTSVEVLHGLALTDPRIRVIELPNNGGESAARNAGIEAATGDYVSCLDADDELPPRALERLLTAARSTCCTMALGRLDWCRDASDPPQPLPGDEELSVTTEHVADSAVLQSVPGNHCCNLYDRELLDGHDIRYVTDLSLGQDQLFPATAIAMAGRVAMIDEVVYVYHHYRPTSITRRLPDLNSLLDRRRAPAAHRPVVHGRRSGRGRDATAGELVLFDQGVLAADPGRPERCRNRSILRRFLVRRRGVRHHPMEHCNAASSAPLAAHRGRRGPPRSRLPRIRGGFP